MEISVIIASVASIASIALPFVCQETIKEAIKKSFSDLSAKQVRQYFLIGMVICFIVVSGTGFGISAALTSGNSSTSNTESTGVDEYQNDSIQAIVDLVKTGLEKTEGYVDKKRTRDSIAIANREKRWVYKIGDPKVSESEAWESADELAVLGDILIFKEERKRYQIICDPANEKATLEEQLPTYKSRLDSLNLKYRIEIIDLMNYCGKKESIIETETIQKRKQTAEYRCLTCDK